MELAVIDTGFKITTTGLEVYGIPSFEDWMKQGRELWFAKQSIQWCIGDWINFGEKAYGEKYSQAINDTDYTPQTLMNYAYTCRAILPTARRENVSFSNHSEVASLSEDDREYALDMLESKQWNRAQVRTFKKELKGDDTDTEQTVTLRFTHMQRSDDKLIVVFIPPDGEIIDFKAVVKKAKPKAAELDKAG